MTKSAVAEREDKAELERQDALENELVTQNQGDIAPEDIQIPLLKVGQQLTDEVAQGDASAGEFINALTREGLGNEIDFIVAGYSKGRFFHGDRKAGRRARKAYGVKNVPWRDDPHYGEPFTEHPDAEEKYSERANSGEIQWGKGPPISTTYDFTGFVISGLEEGEPPLPVCLSLMRSNSRAARKWSTLLQAVLRGKYWDRVFHLSTERVSNDSGTFHVVNVKQGRKTTPEERGQALQLALVLRNQPQNVSVVGEDDESKPAAEPEAAGGMAV